MWLCLGATSKSPLTPLFQRGEWERLAYFRPPRLFSKTSPKSMILLTISEFWTISHFVEFFMLIYIDFFHWTSVYPQKSVQISATFHCHFGEVCIWAKRCICPPFEKGGLGGIWFLCCTTSLWSAPNPDCLCTLVNQHALDSRLRGNDGIWHEV